MAQSKCPQCSSTMFEMKENSPRGSRFKILFVQCYSCGTVVGVTEWHDIPSLLQKIAAKLGITNLLG